MMLRKVVVVVSAMLYGPLGLGPTAEAQNVPVQPQEPVPLERIRDLLSTWADVEANYEMLMSMAIEGCEDTKRIHWESNAMLVSDSLTRGEVILHELAGAVRNGQPGPSREALRNRFQSAVIDLYKQDKPGLRRPALLEVLFHSKYYNEVVAPEPDTSKEMDFFVLCLNDADVEIRKLASRLLCKLAYTERSLYNKLVPVLEAHIARGVQDKSELENMKANFEMLQSLVGRLPDEGVWHRELHVTEQDYWKLQHMSDQELLELLSSPHWTMTWDVALNLLTQEAPRRGRNTRGLLALVDKHPANYKNILWALARPVPETASEEIKAAEDMFVDYLESAFDEVPDEGQRYNIIEAMRSLAREGVYRVEFKGGTKVHGEPHSRERVLTLLVSYLNHNGERTRHWAQKALEDVAPDLLKKEEK